MSTVKPRKVARRPKKLPGKLVGKLNGLPVRRLRARDLDPADYNPREISESNLQGLKVSVGEFGLPQPIVWNRRTRRIVGGHQRLKTLAPGAETDVIEVDLDEAEERALNLALNNPHAQGDWTEDLAELLAEVKTTFPELSAKLNFADLEFEVPEHVDLEPPSEFPEIGEDDITTTHECPRCGYQW